ncbi:Transcription initiation factor IIB [Orchesella cincta]|uniref:Transcription initiation factor IIB n=1 Tax=Orchesella cincta TaxID=48709 RepID=A0A1D2M9D7_ORCCI|nr:Transcription initiation factor IIB [Orchesella cincta]
MSRVDFTHAHCRKHPEAPLVEDCRTGDQICGLAVGDRVIDIGSEWRTFSNEAAGTDPCRVGGAENPLLNGSDLTRHIGGGIGTPGLMNLETQNINRGKQSPVEIMIRDGKKLKGRPTDAILSACLYIASRQEGVPQTIKEVCGVSRFSKNEIGRAILFSLGLSNTVRNAATAVAKAAEDLEIVTGRSPLSVAAAAIYMVSQVSKFKRSPKEISKVAGVSDVIVRQVYKLMYSRAGELFPKDFVFFTPIDMLCVA